MFNHAPVGHECEFCAFGRGEENNYVRRSHFVERTADTLSFISPKWWVNNEGHVLVVPLDHFENLYDLPDRLAIPLLSATRRAALALKSAYACAGTSVRQHNEPAGNQDMWHYHVHVFPRYDGDQLYGSPSRWASAAEMDTYAHQLRTAYTGFPQDG